MEYSISPIFAQGNFRTISPRRSAVDAKRLQRNMYPRRVQKRLFERCIDGDSGRLQVPSAEKKTVLRDVEEPFAWVRDLRLGQIGSLWNPAGVSRDLMAYFRRVFYITYCGSGVRIGQCPHETIWRQWNGAEWNFTLSCGHGAAIIWRRVEMQPLRRRGTRPTGALSRP